MRQIDFYQMEIYSVIFKLHFRMCCCAFLPCFENNTEDTEHRCSNCDHLIGTACSDDILAGWKGRRISHFIFYVQVIRSQTTTFHYYMSLYFFVIFLPFFHDMSKNIWIPFGNYTSSQKNYILNKTHAALHFQKISNFKIPVLKFYNRAAV